MTGTRKKSTASRRKGTRKNGKGIVYRITSPVGHVVNAVNKTAGVVINYTKNILSKSIKGVRKVGGILVKTTNKAVSNVTKKGSNRGR